MMCLFGKAGYMSSRFGGGAGYSSVEYFLHSITSSLLLCPNPKFRRWFSNILSRVWKQSNQILNQVKSEEGSVV